MPERGAVVARTLSGDNGDFDMPVPGAGRGAIRMLRVERLTPDAFEARAGAAILAPASFAPFDRGLHTLAACGDVTMIDAKRFDRSSARIGIEISALVRRFGR